MEEIKSGNFVKWESEGRISILLKINDEIIKYTLIPKDENYLIVRARRKAEWSTLEYYEEKSQLNKSKTGTFSLFKDARKQVLRLGSEEFILPHGLPIDKPQIAMKSNKPLKFKKYKQKKLFID